MDRIVFLGTTINDDVANVIIAQLLFLQSDNPEKDIYIYINSPGGSVYAGLAIYDTMKFLSCDVNTYCMGIAASMGSFLLAAGTKGKRFALPNSRIMMHQPSGGSQGTAADIEIQARELLYVRERMNLIYSENTGQTPEKIAEDLDRDRFMSPVEAKAYGLVDHVIEPKGQFSEVVHADPEPGVAGCRPASPPPAARLAGALSRPHPGSKRNAQRQAPPLLLLRKIEG